MEYDYSSLIRVIRKYGSAEYTDKEFTILAFNDLVQKHNVGVTYSNHETLRFDLTPRISEMCSKGKIQYSLLLEAPKKDTLGIIQESIESYGSFDRLLNLNKIKELTNELKNCLLNASNISPKDKEEIKNIVDLKAILSYSIFYSLKYGLAKYRFNQGLKSKSLKSSDKPLLLNIIKRICEAKINGDFPNSIPKRPYNVEEKCELNQIDDNLSELIKETLDNDYEIIMDVMNAMVETEPLVIEDLSYIYRMAYFSALSEMGLNIKNLDEIRSNSTEIFYAVNEKVLQEAKLDRNPEFDILQVKAYLLRITTVLFYKCKFLIPIGKEDTL